VRAAFVRSPVTDTASTLVLPAPLTPTLTVCGRVRDPFPTPTLLPRFS